MEHIEGHGGIRLAVYEHGRADGPAVLLIHGFSQAALSWSKQWHGALAQECRLISLDIRGHGASDKPMEKAAYDNARPIADDIEATLDHFGADKTVVVGWSMGGNWTCDYLRHHGETRVAGLVLVSAPTQQGTEVSEKMFGTGVTENVEGMFAPEPSANIAGTKGFLRACTASPLPDDEFADMLAFNMMVPPEVRLWMLDRAADNDDVVGQLSVPVLQIHGAADKVVLPFAGEYTLERVPHTRKRMIVYDNVGHCPFWETAERFDADVLDFVRNL